VITTANAIEFHQVTKTFYRGGGQRLLRSYLAELIGGRKPEGFSAIKGISFRISPGESVAIVGPNGAGKSTLLSLVTRLAPPTSGAITVNGRIAALLDLAAGFHPDLTGHENVMLNAALLGFSRRRATEYYERIVEFAELAEFMNEPLRTFSSGMMLRLGFSVAVSLDPDILIIDEVLAVGDQSFQAKCIERIFQIKHQGKTILCVSHVGSIIHQLCERAMWLDHGELLMDGSTSEVLQAYEGWATSAAESADSPES
jgi:ABC-type polysaccharide/polyol phosphate transport system ATPase subunit